jgi:hypothetical protein
MSQQIDTPEIDDFDPAVRTVAARIYYALNRAQFLRQLIDACRPEDLRLDRGGIDGLCDALEDIERALEPISEACGPLPLEVDNMFVRDELTTREREWREARRGVTAETGAR